jgi:hypothetical protein
MKRTQNKAKTGAAPALPDGVELVTRGTGITAQKYAAIKRPTPGAMAFAMENFRERSRDLMRAGTAFGADVSGDVDLARAILARAGDGEEAPDSPEDFARRILNLYGAAESEIARGAADRAAMRAVQLGRLIEKAALKFEWEADALRGAGLRRAGREGAAAAASTKRAKNAERDREIRRRAAEIEARRPAATCATVIKHVVTALRKNGVQVSESTAKRVIGKKK